MVLPTRRHRPRCGNLGAEIVQIGDDPNGTNINDKCGSTAPQAMCEKVREVRADIGIALDGDADRVIICDEQGEVVDGDQLMALVTPRHAPARRIAWRRTGGYRHVQSWP